MSLNPEKLRNDFKIFEKDYIYMDSSCVSLKPEQVIEEINEYYREYPACGGRSNHRLARQVTDNVESSRKILSKFINSKRTQEIIFTKNTTESLNIVANSFPFKKGQKVLISDKEHNSNLVPWQLLAKRKGIKLEIFRFGDVDDFEKKVKDATLTSFVQSSNLDGSTQDSTEMTKIAHRYGAKVMIDGAQSAPHKEINIKKMDADFFCASGHKMLGPSGTGILYGKEEELNELSGFIVGGETVKDTTYTTYVEEDLPHKFEAGLQNYAGIAGLGAAAKYLLSIGLNKVQRHEAKLNKIISEQIVNIPGLKILGPENSDERGGIVSFTVEDIDPHDIALQLDSSAKILIRSGYHCCHSWFNANKINGSARASLYIYNTHEEAEKLVESLKRTIKILK